MLNTNPEPHNGWTDGRGPVTSPTSARKKSLGMFLRAIIGGIGYIVARASGKTRLASAFYGLMALALGVVVALVKSALAAH